MNTPLVTTCCLLSAALALASAGALCADLALAGNSTTWQVVGAVLGIGAAIGGVGAIFQSAKRQTNAAAKFLAHIRNISPQQFGGDIQQLLPEADGAGSLNDALQQLREQLIGVSQSYQEVERDRALAEVRYRRALDHGRQLNEIVDGLSEPVLAVNQYDELIIANQSASELFEFGDGETEQQAVATLIQCQELLALLKETRRHKAATRRAADVEITGDDGTHRWFNATVEALSNRGDATGEGERGVVAVLRDVSEHKEIQRRHAEFVSSVSHEMKTPLASIKAYVELLADGDAEDEQAQQEFLDVINGQADRLQRLIDNLLNIARIEAGVVHVNKEEQSLNELLDEAFSVVQPSAEQKDIRLVQELSSMYLGVLIDRDMVLQAAINLLSNAVKYTPAGGQVTLRSRTRDGEVVFEVEDTGVGLSEEDASRIFEKFYRVKKDKSMAPGTGLGLPLAKHIVEDVHGGRLQVQSTPGKGSIFSAVLPTDKRL